jgi:hypothetical protein
MLGSQVTVRSQIGNNIVIEDVGYCIASLADQHPQFCLKCLLIGVLNFKAESEAPVPSRKRPLIFLSNHVKIAVITILSRYARFSNLLTVTREPEPFNCPIATHRWSNHAPYYSLSPILSFTRFHKNACLSNCHWAKDGRNLSKIKHNNTFQIMPNLFPTRASQSDKLLEFAGKGAWTFQRQFGKAVNITARRSARRK